jgi:uncharacterized membrane protein YraQ (UPF0718 family)
MIYFTTFYVSYTIIITFIDTEVFIEYEDIAPVNSSTIIIISVVCAIVIFVIIGGIVYVVKRKIEESSTQNSYSEASSSSEQQFKLFHEADDNKPLALFNDNPEVFSTYKGDEDEMFSSRGIDNSFMDTVL